MEEVSTLIQGRLQTENINTKNIDSSISFLNTKSNPLEPNIVLNSLSPIFKPIPINTKAQTNFTPNNLNNPSIQDNNKFRHELIMSKIIISELQDNINTISNEKKEIESQLNEALNSIKSLHKDYISLTEKFTLVNNSLANNNINNKDVHKTLTNNISSLENQLKKMEQENLELKAKKDELTNKLFEIDELNKLEEEKLNIKLSDITERYEKANYELEQFKNNSKQKNENENTSKNKLEEELKSIKKENLLLNQENIDLNNKYVEDKKNLVLEIEKLKSKINLLESQNYQVATELKEKSILLEKELKLNEQYNTLEKHFNNSLQEKNTTCNTLNDQYIKLFKEFNEFKVKSDLEKEELFKQQNKLNNDLNKANNLLQEYKNKIQMMQKSMNNKKNEEINNDNDINIGNANKKDKKKEISNNENDQIYLLNKQNEYILSLLLKITPNAKLIKQIIDLHAEIVQLEKQREAIKIKIKENPNAKIVLTKIDEQIKIFKTHLTSLEDELTSVDFGSSRIMENSLQM